MDCHGRDPRDIERILEKRGRAMLLARVCLPGLVEIIRPADPLTDRDESFRSCECWKPAAVSLESTAGSRFLVYWQGVEASLRDLAKMIHLQARE